LFVQLVFKVSNLCDPDPPTSQTDGQTDGRHAVSIPLFAHGDGAACICSGSALSILCPIPDP